MKAYTQFLKELPSKKVVFAFGRFQPPTTGHELLVRAVERLASTHNASHVIYASRTQDKTKNPLPVDRKVYFLKRMFPTANFMAAGPTTRTFIEVAKELNKKYKDIIMVAGSDRVVEYTKLLNQYNGKEFNFNTIQVVSAGERDPDSDDASGMSGTKMRDAAKKGDFDTFKKGLPTTLTTADSRRLMNELRHAMGLDAVKEQVTVTDWLRESYYRGEVFKVGQIVESNGEKYEILDRGSNYLTVVDSNGSTHRKWLHDVSLVEDYTVADEPTTLTYKNYTPKNIEHPQALDAFAHIIKQEDLDPVAILNALKATDEYYGILNKAVGNDEMTEEEVAQFESAVQRAQEYLAKLGVLHHHADYINHAIHDIDQVRAQYHMEKEEGMEESMKTFKQLIEMKFSSSDKIKVARIIADALGVTDVEKSSSADQLVNNALRKIRNKPMRAEYLSVVKNMLQTAREAGINYDEKLLPQKVTEGYDEVSTSDTKLDKHGRKIRAHKLRFKNASKEDDLEEGTFKYHMDKAVAAHMKGDSKKALYHLDNAKTARYAMPTKDYAKNKDLLDKYKQMREETELSENDDLDESAWGKDKATNLRQAHDRHMEKALAANKAGDDEAVKLHQRKMQTIKSQMQKLKQNEEVELSENAPFKKLEHAVAYATDKVKTHRDNLDGIEVYKHKAGGYDVNHTMNANGRNSLHKSGAKHLGTVYKDKPTNIKEEAEEIVEDIKAEYDSLKKNHDIKSLRGLIKSQHKIIDTSEFKTKDHAISHYLRTKHGDKKVAAAFGLKEDFDILEEAAKTIDKGEYDYEGQMARTQLQTTLRNCEDLIDMIEDDENMPEWVQSKITLAQDYITTVRDYLQSREELGEATAYYNKPSFLKKMSRLAKQERQAREKKEAEQKKQVKEDVDLDEAVKIGTKVKMHSPGKDYHDQVGTVGEIRNGAFKGAAKTYTVDYGNRKSVQLSKDKLKLHKEESQLDEDCGCEEDDKFKVGDTGKMSYESIKRFLGIQNISQLDDLNKKSSFTAMQKRHMTEEEEKESEEEDFEDDDFEDEITGMSEPEHIIDAYEDDEIAIVDDETGEELDTDGYEDDDKEEEAKLKEGKIVILEISRMERIRRKQRFARTKSKREVRAQIALRKTSNQATISKRARRLATSMIKRRMLRKDPNKATLPEKERVERFLQTRKALVDRLARRVAPRIRQIEKSRLQHKRFTK